MTPHHIQQSVPLGKDRFTCFYKLWIKRNAPSRVPSRVKIKGTKEYAGMMELADMQDLGDVTLGKVFHFVTRAKIEYAPVAKMVYAADLGDVTSEKVFPPPLSLRTSPHTGVAIRSLR